MLSDIGIIHRRHAGDLVIEPFARENVGPNSYDLTLGEWFYRERFERADPPAVFNPFSEDSVHRTWGTAQLAGLVGDVAPAGTDLTGVPPDARGMVLMPGESLLCHTQEFVGARRGYVGKMQARSSYGRSFITVCRCAGLGDVGYVNRWTMEVTNAARYHRLLLVAGMRIAQMTFEEVTPKAGRSYGDGTGDHKYQAGESLEGLVAAWDPSMMLPRLYADREIAGAA